MDKFSRKMVSYLVDELSVNSGVKKISNSSGRFSRDCMVT